VSFVSTIEKAVVDADIFKKECIKDILAMDKKIVLTPHPKEFCSLWKKCTGEELDVNTLQKDRFTYAQKFSEKYKDKTLVLKGSNTIVAENGELYVMPLGSAALAKGGSGDALAGVIASLLAQGYGPLEAAKNCSLMIALSAAKYKGANYSLTIEDLLEGLKWL
ncbi:MAG TPA: NAD(P)H-hydrate dehydratase, partial [Campylobacterales bacterium]|nr:NAD(P)H-hydrate dehydratase [Campylobacterales bacterium]